VKSRYNDLERNMPGGLPLAPAFAIGYRADPALAPMRMAVAQGLSRRVTTPAGVNIDVIARAYVGQNQAAFDVWSTAATVELNDVSGLRLRSNP